MGGSGCLTIFLNHLPIKGQYSWNATVTQCQMKSFSDLKQMAEVFVVVNS